MLLEISIFPITIVLVLLALPSSNTYSSLNSSFSVIILFILISLVPLNTSVFSLTPLVATSSVILWITSIMKRFIPYNYSHAYYVPTSVPYPLIPLLYFLELVSDLVRPIALTVRIVVNLSLSHLFIHISASALMGVLIPLILIFELAVAFIQSFIYSSLPSLW